MKKLILLIQSIIIPATFIMSIAVIVEQRPIADVVEVATIPTDTEVKEDLMKEKQIASLERFFKKYNSPLVDNAETFVDVANANGLDYKLLPAIACMESSCGKRLIPESYNPFGWGIYGNKVTYFKDYDHAIQTVGKGLKDNYVSKGFDTPEKMAPIYTPPNHKKWLSGITYFMSQIDESMEIAMLLDY